MLKRALTKEEGKVGREVSTMGKPRTCETEGIAGAKAENSLACSALISETAGDMEIYFEWS